MTVVIRRARVADLDQMATLAADAQADPDRFCAYLAADAGAIAADVAGVIGPNGGDWTDASWVALDDARNVIAWLVAEVDDDMDRVWWWGPIVADEQRLPPVLRDGTMDQLFAAANDVTGRYDEHELAIDDRSTMLRSFASRHGFVAEEASAMLRTPPLAATGQQHGDRATDEHQGGVVALAPHHHASVVALHDSAFPGTHTTGEKLVEDAPGRSVLVIDDAAASTTGAVAGYVAVERQSDGSLYIDYLAVANHLRGRGIGRRLVSEAVARGAAEGATHAHLTVRVGNVAARRLYASVGFVEESILLPLRRGFSVP
ncbi:GNAT family N-acetyltransferase [Ilumatobacter coccineus]|uniref:N-acetyltransferase domain-containing protein n=1 Tax=Ilumatobacter coccineus (strain NBRC 103263 / KCTC 29153 / YM16-304) TaxID=1313172 RepID=A0A6C7EIN7_ILUCY|nr:N-acetyltransferase [Ilumatobacter coccineus]BAN03836.1 hypothetical protein YM304_35220 [Ilumatobacter coccineus YM16-304]